MASREAFPPRQMASQLVFTCCTNPIGVDRKLGVRPHRDETLTLIGWRLAGCDRATTLHYAATILARALTIVARVTFPSSSIEMRGVPREWRVASVGLIRSLGPASMVDRLSAHGVGPSNDMMLISTVRDTVCAELFEDPGYPWSIQRQTAILSPWDAPPPQMNRGDFVDLMNAEWDAGVAALWRRGVTGIVRPALGGEGVGIVWRSDSACQSFINAMAGEGQRPTVEWMPLAESDFASWLEVKRG